MKLKRYQTETLSVLRRFLEAARVGGARGAYESITREPAQARRLGRFGGRYEPLAALPEAPYVCLRLPTGGGKTILASHAVAVARDAWIEKEYPVVLWLVPSNTIRRQTAEALKDPRHPYRRALDEAFDRRVRVFDIADFAQLRPHDLGSQLCVVVGTIQTLRVTNTEGRKVYAHHEELEPHFSRVPANAPGLEPREDGGGAKFSFANLLHLHRPLMIVDEAHNAVSGLTREMQARVNPCAIIEFTATPRPRSNILHSVTAQELREAEMIKLPIFLYEHDSWQNAVNGAIAARASLAEVAAGDAEYIRPLVLFQAQPKDQEVTAEALRRHLIEVEQIDEAKIAVVTGDQRELDGIDLFDPACGIEYVITVEALKEGWDCSFAYVFCSVARIRSTTDVEQLLGRVLRMPYAQRRRAAELNRAYAFLSEPSFGEAARSLADTLVRMGFEEDEASDAIEPQLALLEGDDAGAGPLFAAAAAARPVFTHALPATPELRAALESAARADGAQVELRDTGDGRLELVMGGPVDAALESAVAGALPAAEREGFVYALARHRMQ
ncbi:MAG TPA: DEAD/DEAH box helicase family protein, partial [Longimicrobiaceae bacterium]|nr:DEAD/DEAH box helicase family protein [Longimicrobiaceae bacterium]